MSSNSTGLFERLRTQVAAAFEKSDIKQKQQALGKSWYYDVCALPLRPGKPLLLGLNWGDDPSARHLPQKSEPGQSSFSTVKSWRFIASSEPFLRRYFHLPSDLNYFNVCPFRSEKVTDLTDRDWRLAIDEFFLDAIDAVNPPSVLMLGASNVERLTKYNIVNTHMVSVDDNGRSVNAHVGTLRGRALEAVPFFALPHPGNHISTQARQRIWAKAFESR